MVHGQVTNDALSHARLGSILFKCPFWSVLFVKVEIPIHCNGHFIIFSPGGGAGVNLILKRLCHIPMILSRFQ